EATARACRFMMRNDIFFLPFTMAASKSTMLAAEGVIGSTIVTCMAMNGLQFGIKVSGLATRWFTAPLPLVQGAYFAGFGPKDANPAIGDSEIAETNGLGAFAIVGSTCTSPLCRRYPAGSDATCA